MSETASERPQIPIFSSDEVRERAAEVIDRARTAVSRIESLPLDSVDAANVLDAWDEVAMEVEDVFGPISILNSVHPDQAVRDAGDDALIAESSFLTDLFQSEAFYRRVEAVIASTASQKKLRSDLLEDFEDSGVSLPPEKRVRFKQIADRLTELGQEFAKNIRENPERLTFTPQECEGLPESWLERMPRDSENNLVVGFDYPDYVPFMQNSRDEGARRRYWIANTNRGTAANLAIMDEIVALRKEMAALYDLPSYAHYVTRRGRMAESPETVAHFLGEVRDVVTEAEVRDLRQLAEMKARLTGAALDAVRIERWDVSFYRERLREERFAVDQEALRAFFPTGGAVQWMLDVSARLYGIRFEKRDVPVWHEDVIHLDVFDAPQDRFIGGIYLDLYPRDGKYKHAAAWPVRGVSRKAGRTPISVLVTNFNREGLTHDELETLLHEFGHVLHGVLSDTEYLQHSGTSVERDFVEAPSQMYEEWANRIESLSLLAAHCPGAPVVDQALVDRLDRARKFGAGIDYGRQLLYAAFDMELSSERPRSSIEVWSEMEGATPMGHVAGTSFPGTFEHIASGYAAGYYGYMWAKVIALDLVSAFGADVMNSGVGRRFRELVLSRGSEAPAREIVEQFLGREVSRDAFFSRIGGQ